MSRVTTTPPASPAGASRTPERAAPRGDATPWVDAGQAQPGGPATAEAPSAAALGVLQAHVSRLKGFRPRLFRLRGDELTCFKARPPPHGDVGKRAQRLYRPLRSVLSHAFARAPRSCRATPPSAACCRCCAAAIPSRCAPCRRAGLQRSSPRLSGARRPLPHRARAARAGARVRMHAAHVRALTSRIGAHAGRKRAKRRGCLPSSSALCACRHALRRHRTFALCCCSTHPSACLIRRGARCGCRAPTSGASRCSLPPMPWCRPGSCAPKAQPAAPPGLLR